MYIRIEISNLYSDVIFNTNPRFGLSKNFIRTLKKKYISFIEEQPLEKNWYWNVKIF